MINLKKNFLIIGVGGIGFRHFQSVNKINNINIYLVDPKIVSINKNRISKETNKKNKYFFLKNINQFLKKKFELIIVSTNSNIRFKVFEFIVTNRL